MAYPTWPASLLPSTFDFQLSANTQSGGRSPFDGTEQTLEQPGGKWVAKLAFQNLTLSEGRLLQAWLHLQRGRAGRFYWGPPAWPALGSAPSDSGSAVIDGAGQTGILLRTRGWPASRPAVVYPGDLVAWLDPSGRPQLHQVVTDGASPDGVIGPSPTSAGGQCSFRVSPPIRRSPNDGASLNFGAPVGLFRLSRDQNPVRFGEGMYASADIDIEEALF